MTVKEAIARLHEVLDVMGDVDIVVENNGMFENNLRINGAKILLTKHNVRIATFPHQLDVKRNLCLLRYGN